MKKTSILLSVFLAIGVLSSANAQVQTPRPTSLAELTNYNNGVATYSIIVCDEMNAEVIPDIVFSNVQEGLALAELKLLVSHDKGFCMGGRKEIQFDVKQLLASKIRDSGISSTSVLLKSLPNRIEIIQK
jgi:hypothetical protein